MKLGRSAEEIQRIVEGYRASGLGRRQYCEEVGIGVSTLDYYLMRERKGQRMVRVRVAQRADRGVGFAVVLVNGRRIESGWEFGEAELARLIRVAEAS